MKILDRFLRYVKIATTSDSNSNTTPSTDSQRTLANLLVKELEELGVSVYYDQEFCYTYGVLKGDENLPSVGFISHLDTSEDAKGYDINPRIIENYNGEDVFLNEDKILEKLKYPDLVNQKGKTLITTDGTTLLGADDKAGIAEIMNMIEYFVNTKERHGDIYVCFTPDEEIGLGVEHFDFTKFHPDYSYTVDGSTLGELSYENFNAATAIIEINGVNTHCGYAKGVMVNSLLIAQKLHELLPHEYPETTEKYEGYFHLEEVNGTVSKTTMKYLIRDFDKEYFEYRKDVLTTVVDTLNETYQNRISLKIEDSYYNMKEVVLQYPDLKEMVVNATIKEGVSPFVIPIRGGTDGAELSRLGLPCPNIGTGGHNFHSIYEYISLEDMESASNILIGIIKESTAIKGKRLTK